MIQKPDISIYNTFTQRKETLVPNEEGKVKMYVCGLTTYDYSHLGHARMLVAFDVIVRHLRVRGFDVTYVRNITDIGDKILQRASENKEIYSDLTTRFIDAMHEDEKSLSILPPDIEPKATGHINEIIKMIETLVEKEYAYRADNGDVYFEVESFPNYGRLSKKKMEDLLAGARVAIGELKKDPRDFTLWKAAGDDGVGWDSPWGYGRPGWHIECSAMSTKCLGDNFDIHGGGSDLMFPHHENEIAQSEAASGRKFANIWMHNGPLRVDDEKMSKSLGNFFTVHDLLKEFPGEALRFYMLSAQYRSPFDFTKEGLREAKATLDRFYTALRQSSDLEPYH
ncbi:MAG: cysteine--tRNA ligase, partial [Gammaproteobacteria bacterium]|nr:cysteine--tRNA ligase [Gammaproteobacteria bacterium]